MVTLGAVLLLIGTAVVSGSILRTYPYPPPFEGYGLPGDKPIIAFGVPNFYPIDARKDCDDTDKFVSSEGQKFALPHTRAQFVEVPELQNPEPVVIPEPPILPPFTPPELPFRFAIQDPAPEIITGPKLPTVIKEKQPVISEGPILPPLFFSEIPAPVIKEGSKWKPIDIPKAPILPPLIQPELPVTFNVEELAHIFTNVIVEAPEESNTINEITHADIPEAPVLPPLSLSKILIPIKAEDPAPTVIIEEAPQPPKAIEEPVTVPEAPMLPPLLLPELPVQVAVKKPVVISAAPELPVPVKINQSPEFPSIAPEFVEDIVPKTFPYVILPKLHRVEPFINGRSPIIIKAPVQIVIQRGGDLARLASPDCIATILRERLIPNLVEESQKVIIPGPTSENFAVTL